MGESVRGALRHVRVDDVMSTDAVTVPKDTSVADFIESYALRHKFSTSSVVDKEGRRHRDTAELPRLAG